MVFIDLEKSDFPIVKTLDISSFGTRMVDIAFEPGTFNIYAWDQVGSRLIIADTNGNLLNTFDATTSRLDMGAILFDQYGTLWAYGRLYGETYFDDLYKINPSNGKVTLVAYGPQTTGTDGCACPYTADILETTAKTIYSSCGLVTYEIRLTNYSPETLDDVVVKQTFPDGFTIVNVTDPIGGNVVSGAGTSYLHITNLDLTYGLHIIEVEVQLDVPLGTYAVQAEMSNLPEELGYTKLSDNNRDINETRDSTYITVADIRDTVYSREEFEACFGDSVKIEIFPLGQAYSWSDASIQDSTFFVYESDSLGSVISRECAFVITDHIVHFKQDTFSSYTQYVICKGDSVQLSLDTNGSSFGWSDPSL